MPAKYWVNFIARRGLGVAVGALPGAGADIAAWISYAVSKRFSKEPEKFGTGHVEGMVDAGAANNAALARRVGAGAGVRHSRRFDHRDRDRRALHERHEPRPDRVPAKAAVDLRGVHRVLRRQHAADSAGLAAIQSRQILRVPRVC